MKEIQPTIRVSDEEQHGYVVLTERDKYFSFAMSAKAPPVLRFDDWTTTADPRIKIFIGETAREDAANIARRMANEEMIDHSIPAKYYIAQAKTRGPVLFGPEPNIAIAQEVYVYSQFQEGEQK